MLSCLPADKKLKNLYVKYRNIITVKENIEFEYFFYEIHVSQQKCANYEEFKQVETDILNRKHTLVHSFAANSAVTALRFHLNNEEFTLKTIHSYPEFKTIVNSVTRVIFKLY